MKPRLKDPDILKKKPNLKLHSNHYIESLPTPIRVWDSEKYGTAFRKGHWYMQSGIRHAGYWKEKLLHKIEIAYDKAKDRPLVKARLFKRFNSLCKRLNYHYDI